MQYLCSEKGYSQDLLAIELDLAWVQKGRSIISPCACWPWFACRRFTDHVQKG